MKFIQNAVISGEPVECTIQYDEFDASFNPRVWNGTAIYLEDDLKTAAETFRQMQTV